MHIKKIPTLLLLILSAGCAREHKTFTLKTITLHDYRATGTGAQQLYLKVSGAPGTATLGQTGVYPAGLTLPVIFKVTPAIPMLLYQNNYTIELWGDSSGYISSCGVHMEAYKIVFPIDMEVKNDSLAVSLQGSWQ